MKNRLRSTGFSKFILWKSIYNFRDSSATLAMPGGIATIVTLIATLRKTICMQTLFIFQSNIDISLNKNK